MLAHVEAEGARIFFLEYPTRLLNVRRTVEVEHVGVRLVGVELRHVVVEQFAM